MSTPRQTERIEILPARYPNGQQFFFVLVGTHRIGSFDQDARGYVPFGCRKPIPHLEDAAVAVVQRHIASLLREAAKLSKVLDRARPKP